MLTVTFLSQKGGAGKTTLACAIAVAGESAGHATVLIDLDPQGTASKWSELREAETPVITAASPDRLTAVLSAAREAGAQLAVIDTAPHVSDAALEAARAAHMVLIPCRPSAADLTAIGASVELARQAGVPAHAVLNAAPVRKPAHRAGTRGDRSLWHQHGPHRRSPTHRPRSCVHRRTLGGRAGATWQSRARELEALFTWIAQGALL